MALSVMKFSLGFFALLLAAQFVTPDLTDCPNSNILMDFADGTLDDQYNDCENEMLKKVKSEYLPAELEQDQTFRNAWNNAITAMNKKLHPDLTLEEAAAIRLYTMEEGRLHCKFNEAVRTGGADYTAFPYKSFHFYLTTALKKVKSNNKACYKVYRGTTKSTTVTVGTTVRFGRFASSSTEPDVAKKFGTGTMFTVDTCQGVDIKSYSKFPSEEEVLIPPFEQFKVESVTGPENSRKIKVIQLGNTESVYNCVAVRSSWKVIVGSTVGSIVGVAAIGRVGFYLYERRAG